MNISPEETVSENHHQRGAMENMNDAAGLECRRMLSTYGVALYLGISRKSVFRHVSAGRMPGVVRVGKLLRFDRYVIDKQLAAGNLLLDKNKN